MTVSRAKKIIVCLAAVSLVIGGPTAAFSQVQSKVMTNGTIDLNSSTESHKPECCDSLSAGKISPHGSTRLQWIMFQVLQKINHGLFGLCTVIITALYSFVISTIINQRKKMHILLGKYKKTNIQLTDLNSRKPSREENPAKCTGNSNPNNATWQREIDKDTFELDCNDEEIHHDVALITDQDCSMQGEDNNCRTGNCVPLLVQNLRTAFILIGVALVYIVTYLPAVLMSNNIVTISLVPFYLYYVNNAANPIIYGIFNPKFRTNLGNFFSRFSINCK